MLLWYDIASTHDRALADKVINHYQCHLKANERVRIIAGFGPNYLVQVSVTPKTDIDQLTLIENHAKVWRELAKES